MTIRNEDEKFKQRVARLDQRFRILVSRGDFQQDIANFRSKWRIDPSKLKTNDDSQKWWHEHYGDDDKWRREEWPKHRKELVALREAAVDLKNEKVTYKDFIDRQEEVNKQAPINAYYHDLRFFLSTYKLPPKWERAVQSYIFTDDPHYHGSVGLSVRKNASLDGDDIEKDEIAVILDAYTTKQDLMDEWPTIKIHLEGLRHKGSDKFQPIDDEVFERNKTAYELRQRGLSHKDIADKLNSQYENSSFTYTDVATMIRNYKKISGIN